MDALKHFYRDRGDRLWGNFGFIDAFNLKRDWYATSYLAIDQGPIIDMIENYRSGFLWDLFMANAEIQPALDAIGFVPDSTNTVQDHDMAETISCFPNPVQHTLNITNIRIASVAIITNMHGQQVKVFKNLNSTMVQLPLDDLVNGLYHLTLYDGYHLTTLKFMKE